MTEGKPPLRIRIKHGLWPVFGNRTLMGLYAEARWAGERDVQRFDYSKLVLEIEQTSMRYRRDKDGPAEMIVTEFMPLSLIEDVLNMTHKHGIEIRVKVIEIDEEPDLESY